MNAPFVFGKIATAKNFTDREEERRLLVANFKSQTNTIIISPRRWGKSSLVAYVTESLNKKETRLKICNIDLYNVRNEEDFYTLFVQKILKVTSTKLEDTVTTAKTFLSHLIPKISFSADGQNEITFGLGWNEIKKNPDKILDLAENVARKKRIKIVICIDEFQNISEFESPLFFQRKLRSHFQKHQNVSYCLYGSKRHMMLDVFTNASMPFYKFGTLLFLEKIETRFWIDFILERFSTSGKKILAPQATLICNLAENHPYYVQQISQQAWLRTTKICSEEIIIESHQSIIDQLSLLFVTITETLTEIQLNFLKALLTGETAFSSTAVLLKYHLVNSSNVNRSRKTLIDKEVLDSNAGKIEFQDPMYKHWLKTFYFGFKN